MIAPRCSYSNWTRQFTDYGPFALLTHHRMITSTHASTTNLEGQTTGRVFGGHAYKRNNNQFGLVSTNNKFALSGSGFGRDLTAPFAQRKNRIRNTEESFRIQENLWLTTHWAKSPTIPNYRFDGSGGPRPGSLTPPTRTSPLVKVAGILILPITCRKQYCNTLKFQNPSNHMYTIVQTMDRNLQSISMVQLKPPHLWVSDDWLLNISGENVMLSD